MDSLKYIIGLFGFLTFFRYSFAINIVRCDVVVAGGSTAALGAAIAAARKGMASNQIVCLTEPTDWLGGQLTASGVSAVDFGKYNRLWWFQSKTFQNMLDSLGSGNPGNCWVSTKCFLPRDLIESWINQTVSVLPNLKIFYNTVIKAVSYETNSIMNMTSIRRNPKSSFDQWSVPLSTIILDWYSLQDSEHFTKEIIVFTGRRGPRPVIIDATEYGDVIILSEAFYRQGVEIPTESSPTNERCGQSITFPFYVVYDSTRNGRSERFLFDNENRPYSFDGKPWGQIWSYRRVKMAPGTGYHAAHNGEISNQNWGGGNDFKEGYVFLEGSEVHAQLGDWKGGIDVETIKGAESRANGWFNYYKSHAPSNIKNFLYMGKSTISGTATGLSMVPYIRDTRRSFGLDGFVLRKSHLESPVMASSNPGSYDTSHPHPMNSTQYSMRFFDSIAIGNYLYADVHGIARCSWPAYMNNHAILPYHIPFRALTNQKYRNLLVAGKTMSQTFLANAGTRLHPVEFVTGEAAGTAASIMQSHDFSTRQMLQNIKSLQLELEKFMPIFWDRPRYA